MDVTDDETPTLTVVITAASIPENGGTTLATVTRNTGTSGTLSVALASVMSVAGVTRAQEFVLFTEITDSEADVDIEDMIADEDMLITMTHSGYIKRCAVSTYRAQGRGGKGVRVDYRIRSDNAGATFKAAGLFEQADDGSLFLDEVGEMPTAVQSKVLRVLEHGELRRLGSTLFDKVHRSTDACADHGADRQVGPQDTAPLAPPAARR